MFISISHLCVCVQVFCCVYVFVCLCVYMSLCFCACVPVRRGAYVSMHLCTGVSFFTFANRGRRRYACAPWWRCVYVSVCLCVVAPVLPCVCAPNEAEE